MRHLFVFYATMLVSACTYGCTKDAQPVGVQETAAPTQYYEVELVTPPVPSPRSERLAPVSTAYLTAFEVLPESRILGLLGRWEGTAYLATYTGPVVVEFSGAAGTGHTVWEWAWPYRMKAEYGIEVEGYGLRMDCGFYNTLQPGGWRAAWCYRLVEQDRRAATKLELLSFGTDDLGVLVGEDDVLQLTRMPADEGL